MRRSRRWFLVLLALLLAVTTLTTTVTATGTEAGTETAPPRASGPTTTAGPREQIEPTSATWLTDRLVELTFVNPRLNPPLAETKVRVLVPTGFADSGEKYPMVLLLHGIGDTSKAWTSNQDGYPTTLEQFTADKDVIVVMPDGGQNGTAGWYTDWYNGGAYGAPEWETYHLVQLIDYVDRSFPTEGDRNGRVVAGLSMGGYGAMTYAARHPDMFAGAFSFSGALDLRVLSIGFEGEWGPWTTERVRHRAHNPPDLADNLADTEVWFRIGMGVPGGPGKPEKEAVSLEPALWPMNEAFALALDDAGVDYTYDRYAQGGHNWWHWQDGFQRAWPVMERLFDTPKPPPASFDYKAIEDEFSIWGWDVTAHRKVTEFLELDDVSAGGLTLAGSGAVGLVTPPSYTPDASYEVTASGPTASVAEPLVRADDDGRLRFEVVLGPSHTLQQDTVAQQAAAAADPSYWQVADVAITPVACLGRSGRPIPPRRPSVAGSHAPACQARSR